MAGAWKEGTGGARSQVTCCANATQLFDFVDSSPLALLTIRTLPVASMFSDDLARAVAGLPRSVSCGVGTPAVARQIGVEDPRLGEVLLFRDGELVHRGTENGILRRLETSTSAASERPAPVRIIPRLVGARSAS